MSTPEQPATPALTRKQIRELRNTGSTPVIAGATDAAEAPAETAAPETAAPYVAPPPVVPAADAVTAAPFPRPAEPAVIAPAPVADSAVDLGVSPLTRRQARQQERIRTASVPVITPEVVAAHAAATGAVASGFAFAPAPAPAAPQPSPFEESEPRLFATADDDGAVSTDSGMHALFGLPREAAPEEQAPAPSWEQPATVAAPVFAPESREADEDSLDDVFAAAPPAGEPVEAKSVSPLLGASLLDAPEAVVEPAVVEAPPSFDQLLSRTTGAIALPNALIVSQAPEVAPLVAPVTATGEVIVTGTFNLPEGLGSTGHAKGTADGKEIDATLVDGELPSHSSPTPIAASAAVSTVKTPGDVIKPPAPEKGGKLMMSLAITAGVLALALVGVLILAFVTGVF